MRIQFGTIGTLVALALGAIANDAASQLAISQVHRVAGGPGVRDRPSVVVGSSEYAVFWQEAPTLTPSIAPDQNYRILEQVVGFDGTLFGTPRVAVSAWSHQWGATAAAHGSQSWLGYYFADQSMQTGDRDLGLNRYYGFYGGLVSSTRLTRDPPGRTAWNHSSPALLFDPERNILAVASSVGAYLGEPRADRRSYDSVNVEVRLVDSTGAVLEQFLVKGPDDVGESITPALALLPDTWRERFILAYASNAGHRDDAAGGYSLWFELYNRDWRVVGGRHFRAPAGGAANPALATVGGKLYVAWVENTTNTILVSELDQTLHPVWVMDLREALGEAGFAAQFGAGAPGLSAPMLYDDFGKLGLAFVATWAWDAATAQARQEVFFGKVAYR